MTKPLDIGDENLRDETHGNASVEDGDGTYYDGSDGLRSSPINSEKEGTSSRAGK